MVTTIYGIHKKQSTSTLVRSQIVLTAMTCRMIGSTPCRSAENDPIWRSKSALSAWERLSSHFYTHQCQIFCIWQPAAAPSNVFDAFCPHVWHVLVPNRKWTLTGQKFESNEEVSATMEAFFAGLEQIFFSDGVEKWEHRWFKCIELKWDYIEK